MINDSQKKLIQKTWKLVVPIAETAADLFYKRLFELRPDYRRLFPEDMTAQKRKLVRMLAFVVRAFDWSDAQWREDINPDEDLLLVILALGRRHAELYDIPDESYETVGEALLWTLDYGLGEAFTPEAKAAWAGVYTQLATTMKMGRQAIAQTSAEVERETATRLGEEALLTTMEEAGIDEVRLGFPEESL